MNGKKTHVISTSVGLQENFCKLKYFEKIPVNISLAQNLMLDK